MGLNLAKQEGCPRVAPFRSVSEILPQSSQRSQSWGLCLHTRIPSVFLCVLCGDEDIPRLQNPALRNAADFHFSHSSKLLILSIIPPKKVGFMTLIFNADQSVADRQFHFLHKAYLKVKPKRTTLKKSPKYGLKKIFLELTETVMKPILRIVFT